MKTYGQCDSVKALIEMLNSRFKQVKLDNFEEFRSFSSNPQGHIKRIANSIELTVQEKEKAVTDLQFEQKDLHRHLPKIQKELNKKYGTVKKVYGPLKEEIQGEIDDLHNDRDDLNNDLADLKAEIDKAGSDVKAAKSYYTKAKQYLAVDVKSYDQLLKEKEFRFILQGAWGEYKVSSRLQEYYASKKNCYLINALDINLLGKGIQFENHGLAESKLDHVLISEKGLTVLETKAWKSVSDDGQKHLIDQLKKIKYITKLIFPELSQKKSLHTMLVTTELDLEIPHDLGVDSTRLDGLTTLIDSRQSTLSPDDIRLLMNDLLPHLGADQISLAGKVGVKLGGLFSMAKKKVMGN